MKNINEYLISEAAQVSYRVSLLDVKDKEELPVTVTILVDKENVKEFEKYLKDGQDNLFYHAEGGNVEY